jgi:hypothetical protein
MFNDDDGMAVPLQTTAKVPSYAVACTLYNRVGMVPRITSVFDAAKHGTIAEGLSSTVMVPKAIGAMSEEVQDRCVASGEYFRPFVARLAMLAITSASAL